MIDADPNLCVCGHRHLTTRGPCGRWDICGCHSHRRELDPPEQVARRQRELLDALDDARGWDRRRTRERPTDRPGDTIERTA